MYCLNLNLFIMLSIPFVLSYSQYWEFQSPLFKKHGFICTLRTSSCQRHLKILEQIYDSGTYCLGSLHLTRQEIWIKPQIMYFVGLDSGHGMAEPQRSWSSLAEVARADPISPLENRLQFSSKSWVRVPLRQQQRIHWHICKCARWCLTCFLETSCLMNVNLSNL